MFCSNCGHELRDGAEFCSYCGKAVKGMIEKGNNNRNEIKDKSSLATDFTIKEKTKNPIRFIDKILNRKQFLLCSLILLLLLGVLRSTASEDRMGEFYFGLIAWYILLFIVARLRCNHIGTSSNTFICLCILLIIPILSLISWGYLLFKRGGTGYDKT